MDKASLKDSFERILHEADEAYLWDLVDSPFTEEWESFNDPHHQMEMEHFIEYHRLNAIVPPGKTPRKRPRGLKTKCMLKRTGKA